MTAQQTNEFLAEKMFGLKRGVDFDYPVKHSLSWYSADELGDEEGGWICSHCRDLFADGYENDTCYKQPAPDYVSEYWRVLEKLLHNGQDCTITLDTQYGYVAAYVDMQSHIIGRSDTLGKAICRVAVDYLKSKQAMADKP